MNRVLMILSALAAVCFIAPSARAQYAPMPTYDFYTNSIYSSMSANRAMSDYMLNKKLGEARARAASKGRDAAASNAAPSGTSFQPVVASIVPQTMAAAAAKTPADRAAMEKFFTQCLQSYEQSMRQRNQPVKDVARAVAYFIGINYIILHDGKPFTDAQGKALREQIKDVLATDAQFQALTNKDKQQMYETMAITAEYALISAAIADDKGNKQLAEMARAFAKENLEKLLGVPASQIKITDDGLEF